MIVLHDDWGADEAYLYAVADVAEGFGKFDYLRVTDFAGEEWIGQIVTANLNLSVLGRPLDATVLNGLRLRQRHAEVRSIEYIRVFKIALLGEYRAGAVLTWHTRPEPGVSARALDADTTRALLGLPVPTTHDDGMMNVIGTLPNVAAAPLCVQPYVLEYHVLLAGGTGSGKSNTGANLVAQAQRFGNFVVVHDPKPDYGRIDAANSDARVAHVWSQFERFGLAAQGARDLLRIGFYGSCDPAAMDVVVGLGVADLEPEALASVFFSPSLSTAELNAHEAFSAAAWAVFSQEREGGQQPTLDKILDEVARRGDPTARGVLPAQKINPMTAENLQARVDRRRRRMRWLDAVGTPLGTAPRNAFSLRSEGPQRAVERFSFDALARPGRVVVLDYSQVQDAEYALILSFFLKEATAYRVRARHGQPGVVQFIDEGHRIFENRSRHGATLEDDFSQTMRAGRSKAHSIILSVQNASQIPAPVMNQVNSRIVFRQNSKHEADAATQGMEREYSVAAMRLGTGQAIVKFVESPYVVSADMAPSPFELMRTDNLPGAREQEAAHGRLS